MATEDFIILVASDAINLMTLKAELLPFMVKIFSGYIDKAQNIVYASPQI